jgi:hypothetical protein
MIHIVFESRLGTSAIAWVLVENEREMQKGRSVRPCLRVRYVQIGTMTCVQWGIMSSAQESCTTKTNPNCEEIFEKAIPARNRGYSMRCCDVFEFNQRASVIAQVTDPWQY